VFLEFINQSYFVIFNAIALIISLSTYSKYFDTVLKYLPILIAYTLINELLGYFLLYYPSFRVFLDFEDSQTNHIIYNIYDLIYFPFFYYVYWGLVSNSRDKKLITFGAVLVVLCYILNSYFQNPMYYGLYYAYAVASAVTIFCVVLYFIDQHNQNKPILQPYNLVFWVSLGLLILHTFSPTLLIIGYYDPDNWHNLNLQTFHHLVIILMNLLFIIGFIKARKRSFG